MTAVLEAVLVRLGRPCRRHELTAAPYTGLPVCLRHAGPVG